MPPDFLELLSGFRSAQVEFLLIGAHALAAHGLPRATGDMDVWVRPTTENARRVHGALIAFGAPLLGVVEADFAHLDTVYQIGVPPLRVDVLTGIAGVSFDEAWQDRIEVTIAGQTVPVIGRQDLIRNKRAAGRPQDLADVARLERLPQIVTPNKTR